MLKKESNRKKFDETKRVGERMELVSGKEREKR